MKKCILVDVDGTIADNGQRQHWVQSKPKNWKAYNATMIDDKPIMNVINTIHALKAHLGYAIVIVSARDGQFLETTSKWLNMHDVQYDQIYMRATQDYRDDAIVKSELLDQILAEGWDPHIVFDDRNKVVAMWRERGLQCFHVAPGDF